MKRPTPSFTVEVRRHPGRASTPGINTRLFDAKPVRSEFDRESHRAADAVFETKPPIRTANLAETTFPKGRVLESLVVEAPKPVADDRSDSPGDELARVFGRSKASASPKDASAPTPRRRPEPPANDSSALAKAAELFSPRSKAKAETAPSPVAEPAGVPTPRVARKKPAPAKPSLRAKNKVASEVLKVAAVPATPAEPPSAVTRVAPRLRKRMVHGRWVVGDEVKPGERWKLRLRKSR